MVPVAFLAPNQALAIAVFSYNGSVKFGLIGDYDAMPDLDDLGKYVQGGDRRAARRRRARRGRGRPAERPAERRPRLQAEPLRADGVPDQARRPA